jgi:hypothetical protein
VDQKSIFYPSILHEEILNIGWRAASCQRAASTLRPSRIPPNETTAIIAKGDNWGEYQSKRHLPLYAMCLSWKDDETAVAPRMMGPWMNDDAAVDVLRDRD